MVTSPSQTQIALSTPVWFCDGSRAWYMKRQMMPAPMNEIAIGRKISDLAAFSALARSASTATASPSAVDRVTTTITHQMLLKIVPRSTERTAIERMNTPTIITPTDPGPRSNRWLVRRPATIPAMHPDHDDDKCDPQQLAGEDVAPMGDVDRLLVLNLPMPKTLL